LAGVLEIPAIVGVGKFLNDVSGGDLAIVDGNRGVLILNPDEETLERYKVTQTSFRTFETQLGTLPRPPGETKDGVHHTAVGPISSYPQEVEHCLSAAPMGSGFTARNVLYLNKQTDPTEAEHFGSVFWTVLRTLGPKPVVIRTCRSRGG